MKTLCRDFVQPNSWWYSRYSSYNVKLILIFKNRYLNSSGRMSFGLPENVNQKIDLINLRILGKNLFD